MEKEELNHIINRLEETASKGGASFGLFYRDGEDEMYLRANEDGFKLFAATLLKAARDSEEVLNHPTNNYIPFGFNEEWIQGELIAYLKPVAEPRGKIEETPHIPSFKDNLGKWGCIFIIGTIVLSIIVGLITISSWLF